MIGYLIGMVLGLSFVSLAGGGLSYRYGVDTVDASKAPLGMRGSVALLFGVLLCTLGWANVLVAMTARGAVRVLLAGHAVATTHQETEIILVGLALVASIWVLARRGAGWMERVATICASAQLCIAAILFVAILYKYGIFNAWMTDISPEHAYSSDRTMQLTYAVEFGICNSLSMLPYMGGLARLVRNSRHLVGPTILGYAVCGAFFPAVIGALATAATGEAEPAVWIIRIAGPQAGTLLFGAMLLANLGAVVTQIYLAGVSVQQIRVFARLPWPLVVALVLIPSGFVAFNTQWVLDHVMNWLAYNGVMFVGLGSVLFVDFFVLRRCRVQPAHLFAARHGQMYWFWGGVNWVAVVVVAAATALYFWLFDPLSLRVGSLFHYAGAAVPTTIFSSGAYYVLMKWLVLPRGYGGYRNCENIDQPVAVEL
jgi:purine-cytosine permease-like protein